MSTAIWARFAASATRVKSLRKASVDGALVGAGAGGTILLRGDCCVDDRVELGMLEEVERGSIVLVVVGGVGWLGEVGGSDCCVWRDKSGWLAGLLADGVLDSRRVDLSEGDRVK